MVRLEPSVTTLDFQIQMCSMGEPSVAEFGAFEVLGEFECKRQLTSKDLYANLTCNL